jgi:DNA-3-methyladenine glycosylase II
VRLAQAANDELRLSLSGPNVEAGDLDAAESLVRRVFSLDVDGDAFYERVGGADPVLRGLQARFAGLRPVLFGSPFEALCWAVIGQRISIAQAARLKARLAERLGPAVTVAGERFQAFPAPEHLLALDAAADARDLGLPPVKIERLRGLGERGVRGDFDAARLLAMPTRDARAWLEQSPGIGPWASEFALIRGAGHPDLLPRGEQRLLRAVQRYYDLSAGPAFADVEALAVRWAGFRSWAAFLLRVALQADTGEIAAPACGAMAPAEPAHGPR